MASTTAKLEREDARKQNRSSCLSFSRDKHECHQNNGIIRLASTCNPTGVDLQRQGICQLSLQHHCECHNTLSGNEERWCNRCHCNSAERDTVRACRPEMWPLDLLRGCAGGAMLYCTEGSASWLHRDIQGCNNPELVKLSTDLVYGPQ